MKTFRIVILTLFSANALASNCPSGDVLLKNNTSLDSLCPNGFTSALGSQSLSQAIQSQPNNVQMITASAQQNGVPVDLALAVSYQESRFQSCAGSPTGVKGPMQLTQGTARSFGLDRNINEQNIQGGMQVLRNAVSACGSSDYSCLSAHYNGSDAAQQAQWAAGVASADKQLQKIPSLLASACNTGNGCVPNQGDFPTTPAPGPANVTLGA